MKFTANRAELLAQVKRTLKAVPSESTIEVLKGILVEANANAYEVTLTSTNYEAAIQCKLPAAVEQGSGYVFDARLLMQILTLMDGETVSLETYPNLTCTISSGTAILNITIQPGKNYPKPKILRPQNTVKVSNVASAAKSTVYAVAKTPDKAVMSGVRVELSGERLRACGCDGHRLMEKNQKAEAAGTLRFVIPSDSFRMLSGIVTDTDVLEVGVEGDFAVFAKENFLFSTRLIKGEYIDVDKMLVSITPQYIAAVDTQAMAAALDALSVVTGKNGTVDMAFGEGKIQLASENDSGKSNTTVDAEVKTPTPECFRYNLGYLYEALRRMSGKVEIGLSSIGMLLIQTETDTYLQVPLRRQEQPKKGKAKTKKNAA